MAAVIAQCGATNVPPKDRKSTRLNSSHGYISYAVFCLKKKKISDAVPVLPALGTGEWKIGATDVPWHGHRLPPRASPAAELASLLDARGARGINMITGI